MWNMLNNIKEMQNEELNKLKDLYSDLINNIVLLHNRHVYFTNFPYFLGTARGVRSVIRDIEKNLYELKIQVKPAYEEGLENKRQAKFEKKLKKQKAKTKVKK